MAGQSLIGRVVFGACFSLLSASASPIFNFTLGGGITPQGAAGFQAAADRYSALFTDNVTINISIDLAALGPGILGSASSTQGTYTYTAARAALTGDSKSLDDASAVANLQAAPAVSMLLNYTSNSPNGSGSPTPFLDNDGDANNTTIRMSNANAKALGLLAANNAALDASITFSSNFNFDYDPANGITAGSYDFVGIATHEIGHALGFISGVDILDINSPQGVSTFFPDNAFTFVSTLDLYRFSAASIAAGARVIDWTADTRDKYFSIDGGVTNIARYSTGDVHGDGSQASHWKDGLGIGIMDPTAAAGELMALSNTDLRGFDVIGWDLEAVPEPGTIVLMGLGLFGLVSYRRTRSSRAG